MSQYDLAQLNIAKMKAPLDSPLMADFVSNLDRINALADHSPGFVWRLQTDEGDATAVRPMGDDVVVNLSVWRDLASLKHFVFETSHVEIMRRRREWFERMASAYMVLWWVPRGYIPTVEEAAARLQQLQAQGPGPAAFTFRESFDPPTGS